MEHTLTIAEIAKVLEVSRVRVWQLVSQGKLRGVKIGRMWFVTPAALKGYMESRARKVEKAL